MNTVFVRTIPTNGQHDFVGIVTYDNLDDLFYAVDEIVDPSCCEYLELETSTAIFFDRGVEKYEDEGLGEYSIPVNVSFSDILDEQLIDGDWYTLAELAAK